MNIEQQLKSLGLELPNPPKPVGNYQAWVQTGNLLFISGQFPIEHGQLRFTGRGGGELTVEQGYTAARLAALNVLAQQHGLANACRVLFNLNEFALVD